MCEPSAAKLCSTLFKARAKYSLMKSHPPTGDDEEADEDPETEDFLHPFDALHDRGEE